MSGTEPSQQDEPTDEALLQERRERDRKPVLWSARLQTLSGSFDCIALDLSRGGAKVRLAVPLAPDQMVTLAIDRIGALRAKVVWQTDIAGIRTAGLRFVEPTELIARTLRTALPL
ncbi:MAG TPA: PilZ domain-containing protein [Stellaceae bacterium]|nr:PilZ domain-containing protein [Stellaceae bacterium]